MYRFFLPNWPQNSPPTLLPPALPSDSAPPSPSNPDDSPSKTLENAEPLEIPLKLPREEAKHAQRVLRLKNGEQIEIFDGQGHLGKAQLVGPDYGQIKILSSTFVPEQTPRITIAAATPKGPRAEHMTDQLSQAAAHAWIPLRTHHAVVHPRHTKLDRLRRAAIESAKQSRRAHLLQIHDEQPLLHLLDQTSPDTLILAAHQDGQPLANHTIKNPTPPTNPTTPTNPTAPTAPTDITILVGPEGGWSDAELALFDNHKIPRITLGPHIMRIETAALAAALLAQSLCSPQTP